MTAFKHWFTLSLIALGAVNQTFLPIAEAKVTVGEIERACDRALRENTVEALENFLSKYPPDLYRNDVACYALALGALNTFAGDESTSTPRGDDPGGGGYGQ